MGDVMLSRISLNFYNMELDIRTFKANGVELNADDIIKVANANVQNYLDSKDWTNKLKSAFMLAYSNYANAISNGNIAEQTAGLELVDSTGLLTNNPNRRKDANGWVASYLNKVISGMPSSQEKNNTITYDPLGIKKAFKNKYFAGLDPTQEDYDVWNNKDIIGEDGKRMITNRANELAQLISDHSANYKNWDFANSPFTNADDYGVRRDALVNALRNGTLNNDVYSSALAMGLSKSDIDMLLSDGSVSTNVITNPDEEILLEYREELSGKGLSEDLINRLVDIEKNKLEKDRQDEYNKAVEDEDWQNYASSTFTSTANDSWTIKGNPRSKVFWLGNYGNASGINGEKGEYDSEGFLKTHEKEVDAVLDKMRRGEQLSNNYYPGTNISEAHLASIVLEYAIQEHPERFIETADGYIWKPSIRPNGTAYRYNPATRNLKRYHNAGKSTSALNNYYKKLWLKDRYKTAGKYKEGGILKAQSGAEMAALADRKIASDKNQMIANAKAAGRTLKQYRAGNRHTTTKEGEFDFWDTLSDSDRARIISVGLDTAGLLASLTGYGDIINVGTNAASIGANIYADVNDDSMTTREKWANGLIQTGLSAVGLIPGLGVLKVANNARKIAKPVMNIIRGIAAAGIIMNGDKYLESWKKVISSGDKNRLTVNDWKNIAESTRLITNLGRSGIRTAKGKHYAKDFDKIKNSKVTANTKKVEYGENDSWITKKRKDLSTLKSNLSEKNNARWQNIKNSFKPNEYVKDRTKIKAFALKYGLFRNKENSIKRNARDKFFHGTGKHSDAARWYSEQSFIAPKISSTSLPTVSSTSLPTVSSTSLPTVSNQRLLPSLSKYNTRERTRVENREGINTSNSTTKNTLIGENAAQQKLTELANRTQGQRDLFGNTETYVKADILKKIDKEGSITLTKKVDWERMRKLYPHFKETVTGRKHIFTPKSITDLKEATDMPKQTALELIRRKGGDVNVLDNIAEIQGVLYKFKQGGNIQKFQEGGKMHGITSNKDTWLQEVFMPYMRNQILRDLASGKLTVDSHNNYQAQHSGSYNAAKNSGDFYTYAYKPSDNSVAEEERWFQGHGYNDVAIAPNEQKGRYTINGKQPYSKDSKAGGWAEDNLYSGKHDDRHLGREGNWNENSNEFKMWLLDLNSIGYYTYLDPTDKYYKIGKLSDKPQTPQEQIPYPSNPNLQSNLNPNNPLNSNNPSNPSNPSNSNNPLNPNTNNPDANLSNRTNPNGTNSNGTNSNILSKTIGSDAPRRFSIDKISQFASNLLPDAIATGRLIGNLANNNRVYKETLKGLRASLLTPKTGHRTIVGDLATKNAYYDRAAALQSLMGKATSSDASLNAAKALEGVVKSGEMRTQGDLAYNQKIEDTREKAYALEKEIYDYNHNVADENRARLNADNKAKHDLKAAQLSANWTNWDTWLKEQELRKRQSKTDYINWLSGMYLREASDKYINWLSGMYLREASDKLINYKNQLTRDIQNELALRIGKLRGFNYNYPKQESKIDYTILNKRGGKFISSLVRARTKDNEQFQKGVKNSIDHHLKMIDNLSRSTLLAIKKAMGL